MLQIDKQETDGVTVLRLQGRLVLGDASLQLAERVKQLVSEQTTKILVNLEEVTYIDSCGIGDLIASFTSVRKSGGTLKVCGPRGHVLQVLQLVKFPAVVEVYASEQEALASFD